MDLKRGIDKAVSTVVAELKKSSQQVGTDYSKVEQVGTVSANNDGYIGKLMSAGALAHRFGIVRLICFLYSIKHCALGIVHLTGIHTDERQKHIVVNFVCALFCPISAIFEAASSSVKSQFILSGNAFIFCKSYRTSSLPSVKCCSI